MLQFDKIILYTVSIYARSRCDIYIRYKLYWELPAPILYSSFV